MSIHYINYSTCNVLIYFTFRYYLNGNWEVNLTGEKTFAGSIWFYDRKPYKSEVLSTLGPITEDLIIQVGGNSE